MKKEFLEYYKNNHNKEFNDDDSLTIEFFIEENTFNDLTVEYFKKSTFQRNPLGKPINGLSTEICTEEWIKLLKELIKYSSVEIDFISFKNDFQLDEEDEWMVNVYIRYNHFGNQKMEIITSINTEDAEEMDEREI
ncbi:MAG: hypothetical protein MK207_02050 [Saprospiraceae bacterium]|nr:hypothetical protein [Saprospiraceae bacterium]